ncbi:Imm8 family immunity protein [Aureivirga sp. CE67]|uniref:Imm8 family immunity protein n=1 Tax=Aureivirga sp. CE67 TaxID=1788983 RepID=UPI0018CB9A43|nr:Imm8 family immunity protein [Aureivirga sp. CE67]
MNDYKIFSYGSSDCPDLKNFSPKENFFISVEIDFKKLNEEGVETFYFFLCDKLGFENQKYSEELNHIEIIEKYSFDIVLKYIEEKIELKMKELNNEGFLDYMNSNFNIEEYKS